MASINLQLKAKAVKMSNRNVLMTCWMQGNFTETLNLQENSFEAVHLEGSPFCYLLLQEEGNLLRLCLAFTIGGRVQHNPNVTSVEFYVEGIHSSNHFVREMADDDTVWWCSDWIFNTLTHHRLSCLSCEPHQFHLPFNQVVVNFSTSIFNEEEPRSSERAIKEGEKSALDRLSNLLEDSTFSDVTFNVEEECFRAHTSILAAASPMMSAMFQHDFKETRTRVVNIEDTKPVIFKQLLQYIYTGTASQVEDEEVTMDLFVAADKYGVEALKEECSLILGRKLNVDNVVSILILSHLHSMPNLFNVCLSFMVNNNRTVCSHPDYAILMEKWPKLCFLVNQLMLGAGGSAAVDGFQYPHQQQQQQIVQNQFCAAIIFLIIFFLVIMLFMFPHLLIGLTSFSTDLFAICIFIFFIYKE